MLTPTLNNIRSMLVRGAGISLDTDIDALQFSSLLWESGLQRIHASDVNGSNPKQAFDVKSLLDQASWGDVLEMTAHLTQRYENLPMTAYKEEVLTSINPQMAIYLLRTLDDLGEYHTLLQFALRVLALEDMDVVACVASIATFRISTILALSDGKALPLRLLDTYCICRATSPPSRVIVQPLLDIFTHLQIQGRIQEYLEHEIVLWEQTFAVMACSPLSDFQTDRTQPCATLLDDLENVVSQAQVVELDTVERILAMLSFRMLELKNFTCLDKVALRVLFQRVHIHNADHLVLPWLADRISKPEHQSRVEAVSVLILCGGISVEIFTAAAAQSYETAVHASPACAVQVANTVLSVMVDVMTDNVLLQASSASVASDLLLTLSKSKFTKPIFPAIEFGRYMHRMLAGSAALHGINQTEPPAILSAPSFSSALADMLSIDAANVESGLDIDNLLKTEDGPIALRKLAAALLYPTPNGSRKESSVDVAPTTTLQIKDFLHRLLMTVDEMCLPIYRLVLRVLVLLDDSLEPTNDGKRLQVGIASVFKLAMQHPGRCWLQLLPVLSDDMLGEIAHATGESLLSQDNTNDRSIQLDVLRSTAKHLSEASRLQICKTIRQQLAAVVHEHSIGSEKSANAEHVCTLVELALVHSHILLTSTEAQNVRVELLLILPQILTSQHLSPSTATLELVFDAAAYLATDLTATMKDYIRANLGPLSNHPRIRFLFGFRDRPNGWLYATTEASFRLQDGEPTPSESQSRLHPFRTQPWEMLAHSTPNSGVNNAALSLHLFDARQM